MKITRLILTAVLLMLTANIQLSARTLLIGDFEAQASLENWGGSLSLTQEFAAHGKSSLKINLSDPRSRFLEARKLPTDWSDYDLLKFDVYNPTDDVQLGSIQIYDSGTGSDEDAEFLGTSYRGNKIFL